MTVGGAVLPNLPLVDIVGGGRGKSRVVALRVAQLGVVQHPAVDVEAAILGFQVARQHLIHLHARRKLPHPHAQEEILKLGHPPAHAAEKL